MRACVCVCVTGCDPEARNEFVHRSLSLVSSDNFESRRFPNCQGETKRYWRYLQNKQRRDRDEPPTDKHIRASASLSKYMKKVCLFFKKQNKHSLIISCETS